MIIMKKYVLLLLCLLSSFVAKAQYAVSSPDDNSHVQIKSTRKRTYRSKFTRPSGLFIDIQAKGKRVVRNREIGLDLYSHGRRYPLRKSQLKVTYFANAALAAADRDTLYKAGLQGRCKGMLLESEKGVFIEVVVFNNGMAYRYSTKDIKDEYKILNVCPVLPDDKANAILGTFTGDMVFPWCVLRFEEDNSLTTVMDEWQYKYPSNKLVSWQDALSTFSIGYTTNWITGKGWGDVSKTNGVYADFIYKHLYGGLSFSPCQQLIYIYYGYDYDPFLGVMGGIHSWDMSLRFGYDFPIQNGYDVWHFAPYAVATYLNLHQHGKIHPTYSDVEKKNHGLLGLGLKIQYQMRERFTLGAGYEYQLFTGKKEPTGRHSWFLTIGYGL